VTSLPVLSQLDSDRRASDGLRLAVAGSPLVIGSGRHLDCQEQIMRRESDGIDRIAAIVGSQKEITFRLKDGRVFQKNNRPAGHRVRPRLLRHTHIPARRDSGASEQVTTWIKLRHLLEYLRTTVVSEGLGL
jgi:hypothetical protein